LSHEFALNRAVAWLFFTGRLPHDPVGRLFSTVRYAQQIVFADEDTARRTLGPINASTSRRGHGLRSRVAGRKGTSRI
jgi:hypothetical protein